MSPPLPATPTKVLLLHFSHLGGLLRSVLARLFHRRSSPPNPNNPPSNPISASRALGGLAVVLALAVGLLLSLSGPLQAQEAAIEYAENGMDPVATYTAVDPEGESSRLVSGRRRRHG